MNLKLCQEQCGFTRVFEDYRDLLDLKPDLVLVNCENAFHGIIIPRDPHARDPRGGGKAVGLFH